MIEYWNCNIPGAKILFQIHFGDEGLNDDAAAIAGEDVPLRPQQITPSSFQCTRCPLEFDVLQPNHPSTSKQTYLMLFYEYANKAVIGINILV